MMIRNSTVNPTLRVLVVDDDEFMLDTLAITLGNLGFRHIVTAKQGEEALAILDDQGSNIDALLCDLNMPGMDGIEFLRHLAERRYAGGVILVSGEDKRILNTVERLATAHRLNILGALEKPVTLKALGAVMSCLDAAKPGAIRPAPPAVLVEELRRGIEEDELVIFFQPKVAVATREVVGVEALVRWQHPEKGMLGPNTFISVAEESGLIEELTKAVFVKSMRHSMDFLAAGFELKIAINISVDSLNDLDWPEFVVSQASKAGVDPANVMLEVTESRLMDNMTAALEVLTRLSLKKVGLSVDDFGTGYSSLEQLQRVPFRELKIDRAFVNGATRDTSARAILESSIELARKLEMTTVAEGVETQEDWDLVAELGCDLVQGYFVAKPMPAESIEAWLTQWKEKTGQRHFFDYSRSFVGGR